MALVGIELETLVSEPDALTTRFLPHDSKVLLSLLREFSKFTSNFVTAICNLAYVRKKQNDRDIKTYGLWLDFIRLACL